MATKPTKPRPPADLTARSRKLWSAVLGDFELSDAELEVLRSALVALDRADEAASVLAESGLVTTDRYGGLRAHPCVDIEVRNRALFGRLVVQLGIRLAEEQGPRRVGAKPGPRPRQLRPVG